MSRGINVAKSMQKNVYSSYNSFSGKPVVFLSHKSEDKDYVKSVGDCFMDAGIDIYLDEYDFELQTAVILEDPSRITECIQNGISNSDYILCITSEKTVESWWVPYEIGYGKKSDKKIATLLRKDVDYIPDYLKIEDIIDDTTGINNFIKRIARENSIPLLERYGYENTSKDFINKSTSSHKLAKYLYVR